MPCFFVLLLVSPASSSLGAVTRTADPLTDPARPLTGGVLIAYYSSSNHTKTLASAIAEGALAVLPSAHVRLLPVDQATFDADVLWADGVVLGCPVYNANIAGPMMTWLDGWDYQQHGLISKWGAAFATGGHIFGGIESTLRALQGHLSIFDMKLVDGETDFQAQFPFGVGAPTGDLPFNSTIPGDVSEIFLAAARLLGNRVAHLARDTMTKRAEMSDRHGF